MLLSKHIKLIGAFDHRHIFLDPSPDTEKSYQERSRLFQFPRSSWQDYNASLISKGGGIYSRQAKSIVISPEIKEILKIDKDRFVPNELVRALLKAPVDLIWNGGIGTFVKSSQESHLDVGDKTNDSVRINGKEVRARVIAEGGNLGLTQLARIEYSLYGGIIYTDFIDNSAGVNCSDHEVNIKVLLNKLVANKSMLLKERNFILEQMTEEVASLVLRDNYEQTQMLSLEASVAQQTMDLFRRYIRELELIGHLDRKLEGLPQDQMIVERKASNKPLTRPEIAMLLAYCKIFLKQDILASAIPEDVFFTKYLFLEFPKLLCQKYPDEINHHSLRREIIATQLSKSITDRMGINFVERLVRETGAPVEFVLRAYVIAEGIFQAETLWNKIETLDNQVEPEIQKKMMLQIYYLIRRASRWFLRNRKPGIHVQATIDDFFDPIQQLIKFLPEVLPSSDKIALDHDLKAYCDQNVPELIALQVSTCSVLFTSLDIVEASKKSHLPLQDLAKIYYLLGIRLELNWLRELMNSYVVDDQWDELARSGFRDDLDCVQRKLSISVLKLKSSSELLSIDEQIDYWMKKYKFLMERWKNLLTD